MKGSHLLVKHAVTYEERYEVEDPPDCKYSEELGGWIWQGDGEFLVKSQHSGRPRPSTKKQDLETGEDLKGA